MAYDCFYIIDDLNVQVVEQYKRVKEKIPNVQIVRTNDNVRDLHKEIKKHVNTQYYWIIDNQIDLTDFDWNFRPSEWDNNLSHIWSGDTGIRNEYGHDIGIRLLHKNYDVENIENDLYLLSGEYIKHELRGVNYNIKLHDIIYLSYDEEFADENYQTILERFPYAKRVHGVTGIFNAHKKAAMIAETDMFYVIDADAIISPDFNFDYYVPKWDRKVVHAWHSINPINDLVYGYGGVKLFPTASLRNATDWNIDFTTSISEHFKLMPDISNVTKFNTDPFNAWKSAFRECTKLSSKVIKGQVDAETNERLFTWTAIGKNKKFGEYAIAGAIAGRKYGEENKENIIELNKINDYKWLKERFDRYYE